MRTEKSVHSVQPRKRTPPITTCPQSRVWKLVPAEARRIIIEDGAGLLDYVHATLAAMDSYLGTLSAADLEDIVDEQWDPPVSRGARLVSIVDDAIQHLAQAAYVLGMPLGE